ncbi:FadR/GntR family transcriptional regulator [Cohaesibacter intestini]|uniref:FadR/GntR family transcriptional regulator n=1 Tax=Cohaesibacter intestini TaxID=2211145 RepID=UPI000DE9D465|nr:GntR family transcriptional regulator [Cohaesibacter intestini]
MGTTLREEAKLVLPISNAALSQPSRQDNLHESLMAMISDGRWHVGQRLPAERLLCEEFSVSRNTLRSVLKQLEAKGVVTIRRGSGCYLAETDKEDTPAETPENEAAPVLMEKLEAAYLFLPSVFANAARVISAHDIARLEEVTGLIGRAILDKNWPGLREKSQQFFSIIAGSLDNRIVHDVTCEICASSSFLFPKFSAFAEEDRKKMFADFVLVLKAIKARDPDLSRQTIKVKISNVAYALAKLRGIPTSPVIAADQQANPPP